MGLRSCLCGSGHARYPLYDAAGIFCTFVCGACEPEKRAKYNPAIFETASQYAATGEEQDIALEVDREPYSTYGEDTRRGEMSDDLGESFD